MTQSIDELLLDIEFATERLRYKQQQASDGSDHWLSADEEDKTAPLINLQELTGIDKDRLPKPEELEHNQITELLQALTELLSVCNCNFVIFSVVPETFQYVCLRGNFDQMVRLRKWHPGFFELCRPGTAHADCVMGQHCQCAFLQDFLAGFSDDGLTPEEQRELILQSEMRYRKKKLDEEWIDFLLLNAEDEEKREQEKGLYGIEGEEDDDFT